MPRDCSHATFCKDRGNGETKVPQIFSVNGLNNEGSDIQGCQTTSMHSCLGY